MNIEQVNPDPAELSQALSPLQDSEAILVCRSFTGDFQHEVGFEVARCFAIFGFSPLDQLDGPSSETAVVQHDASGIMLTISWPAVAIGIGNEAGPRQMLDDLARVLDAMGWVDFDVYSQTAPEAFFKDLVTSIPASLSHLTPRLCDVPVDEAEFSALADLAQAANSDGGIDGGVDFAAFRDSVDRAQAAIERSGTTDHGRSPSPSSHAEMGMGVAAPVAGNFVPDTKRNLDADTDDLPVAQPIESLDASASTVAPSPSPVATPPVAARRVFTVAGESPVRDDPTPQSPVPDAASSSVATQEAEVVSAPAVDVSPSPGAAVVPAMVDCSEAGGVKGETISAETAKVNAAAVPAVSSLQCAPQFSDAGAAACLTTTSMPCEPLALGHSLVVVCSPDRRWSHDELVALAEGRDIVIWAWQDGVPKRETPYQPVYWDLLAEHVDGSAALMAALWPSAQHDHLALSLLFSLVQRDDSPSMGRLFELATACDGDAALSRLLAGDELPRHLVDALVLQRQLGLLGPAWWRAVNTLWPLVASRDEKQPLSFTQLVRDSQKFLVVMRLDSLDQGTPFEYLVAAAVRWVQRLAASGRCRPAVVAEDVTLAPESKQAMSVLLSDPAAISALRDALARMG